MQRKARRVAGIALVAAGGLLLWLAPESLAGFFLIGAALALEIAGIALERRKTP